MLHSRVNSLTRVTLVRALLRLPYVTLFRHPHHFLHPSRIYIPLQTSNGFSLYKYLIESFHIISQHHGWTTTLLCRSAATALFRLVSLSTAIGLRFRATATESLPKPVNPAELWATAVQYFSVFSTTAAGPWTAPSSLRPAELPAVLLPTTSIPGSTFLRLRSCFE